ncbi:hypothetical protein UNSW1_278 [Campylobacter concisus UNSW1]|jgi:hypothetical protein|uniref:hypothetical protein n=1 Tax=Campylobacter concisus TaxID=199 RepID=UPI0003987DD8|nr:hypothetical protein [Campylobacter concisus]ERJ23127.1 hypothetical protein UNSW1_278 [Campylobacter concisus UNSW1]
MSNIEIVESGGSLVEKVTKFELILNDLGLPSENIIASVDERENIMKMLPQLMNSIPESQKRDATYLSRFVAGAVIGLFDASLNYVWNEVVISLRQKIIYFGIDTFFDNAVADKVREQYKNEDDLLGIKDKTMLETLRKLEWISNVVYLKLCHILDMRNQIGASHPNSYNINSFELLGWLKTCVTEVINDKPSSSAVHIKKIVEQIKKSTSSLDDITIGTIGKEVKKFSSVMSGTLLRALFGIFIVESTSVEARENVLKLSKEIWKYCRDDIKYDIGEKKLFFRNNLQKNKEDLTYKFLEYCDGLPYLSLTERSLEISGLCDDLHTVHNEWDNYYHEPPIAKKIMKYISQPSDIPNDREEKIIKTFLECRIGREVTYCQGVSPGAVGYYDSLFKMLTEEQIKIALTEIKYQMESISIGKSIRAKNIRKIIDIFIREDISDRLKEILNYIVEFDNREIIHNVYKDKYFKDLSRGILDFD